MVTDFELRFRPFTLGRDATGSGPTLTGSSDGLAERISPALRDVLNSLHIYAELHRSGWVAGQKARTTRLW